jgi:hypothetical protein
MLKHHQRLLNNLDTLMLALTKHKELRLDGEAIRALKRLARSRNAFKKKYNEALLAAMVPPPEPVFHYPAPPPAPDYATVKEKFMNQVADLCR